MDKQFLEFWGNFMINSAKGQKQLEDMTKWMSQGLSGFDEMTAMFGKFYGLDKLGKDTPAYLKTWEKATEDFQKSFKEYLSLMGVVPKDEHLTLIKKYEDLKKRVADQEETIKHLRMLQDEKWAADQGEVIKGFQNVVKNQSEQFQELTESISRFFQTEAPKTKDTKKSPKTKRPTKA
ncbi:MAG: hypothetical protein IMF11_01660 [Proteobacteria bacterium]|nr:hypothetical protein [Pseudomonadota bacterium]